MPACVLARLLGGVSGWLARVEQLMRRTRRSWASAYDWSEDLESKPGSSHFDVDYLQGNGALNPAGVVPVLSQVTSFIYAVCSSQHLSMVHTRAFSAERDSLADLALVGTAAMSSERHFLYFRRHHAKHPETGATMTQTRLLKRYYAADYVTRVAVSDDSDAFVDMSLGDEARRMRGTWAAGVWMGDDARLAPERRLVAEGRLMGYSTWSRTWPLDRDKERLLRMGAGRCWPEDSIYKSE